MLPKKAKKIGILTQPLHYNYGGLLQAYALQTVLKEIGFDVWVINRVFSKPSIINIIKIFIRKTLFATNVTANLNREDVQKIIGQHTNYFKEKYIHPITIEINSNKKMGIINTLDFDAFVVGSDQVWRPRYSPSITNYFLDFTKDYTNIKRVSYAASFGVSNWEFSKNETKVCRKLAQKFDAVSVREESGIHLCKEYLGVNAIQVLDPTMLLDSKDYISLVKKEGELTSEGSLMTYILDKTEIKEKFINDIAEKLNLNPYTVMQKQSMTRKTKIDDCIFPPVTKWLKGFMDAEYVVTDSFHGCAFAIIFNKPFLALGNRKRGIARFVSLLKLFELEERLIFDDFSLENSLIEKSIDWEKVNSIRVREQNKSLFFLKNNLKFYKTGLI